MLTEKGVQVGSVALWIGKSLDEVVFETRNLNINESEIMSK
jgi:hypothetical protein